MNLSLDIISKSGVEKRDDLERKILARENLIGVTSTWRLVEKRWLKELDLLTMTKGGIEKWNPPANEKNRK